MNSQKYHDIWQIAMRSGISIIIPFEGLDISLKMLYFVLHSEWKMFSEVAKILYTWTCQFKFVFWMLFVFIFLPLFLLANKVYNAHL